MHKKVYKFLLYEPVHFFKAGQYFANQGWRHKNIVNDGDYELFIMLSGAAYIQIGTERYALEKKRLPLDSTSHPSHRLSGLTRRHGLLLDALFSHRHRHHIVQRQSRG